MADEMIRCWKLLLRDSVHTLLLIMFSLLFVSDFVICMYVMETC